MTEKYICPKGYDCMAGSSCPNRVIECPPGYFCGSYADYKPLKTLDYAYALYKTLFSSDDVTSTNYEDFIEPYRQIQSFCLQGFYCPNATTIFPCPKNHWCPEGTISPLKCDVLSSCPEQSYYEVNYINSIIALLLTLLIATSSLIMNRRQHHREKLSKAFDYKHQPDKAVTHTGDFGMSSRGPATESLLGLEVLMIDYTYEVKNSSLDRNPDHKSIKLLSHVTAKFDAGTLSCILGPSGCGKSTLLQSIRSRSQGLNPCGSIDIYSTPAMYDPQDNGRNPIRAELPQVEHHIGFVPQEDVIDRNLTVRELLNLNASMRRPSLKYDQIAEVVEEVMIDLHIRHIADTVIGGSANKSANVSGGQLKRINIAMELVSLARPALVLLDEPTSGLDAAIANELFENLYKLSRTGITIIAVLQQPREEIFDKMDQVLLMGLGGHVVYKGPPKTAATSLINQGYPKNDVSADADYCLDVLNGIVPRTARQEMNLEITDREQDGKGEIGKAIEQEEDENLGIFKDIILSWRQDAAKQIDEFRKIRNLIQRFTFSSFSRRNLDKEERLIWGYVINFLRQCYLNAARTVTTRLRSYNSLIVYGMVQIILAIALASGFTIFLSLSYKGVFIEPVLSALSGFYPSCVKPRANLNIQYFGLAQEQFFLSIALGCSSALTAVPLFAGKQTIIRRESLAGMSVIAHGIGSMTAELLFVYWNASLFSALWTLFAPAGHWYHWHGTIVCIAFAASSWGYFAAVVSSEGMSSFVSLIIIMICSVFGGTDPTLHQVNVLPVVNWIWYLSFGTWTSASVYFTITQYLQNLSPATADRVRAGAAEIGFQVENFGRPIGILLGLGFSVRILVLLCLSRLERKIK